MAESIKKEVKGPDIITVVSGHDVSLKAQQEERTQSAERQRQKLEDLEHLQISLPLAKAKAGIMCASVKREGRSGNVTARKALVGLKETVSFCGVFVSKNLQLYLEPKMYGRNQCCFPLVGLMTVD